jgi:hypothetical protein
VASRIYYLLGRNHAEYIGYHVHKYDSFRTVPYRSQVSILYERMNSRGWKKYLVFFALLCPDCTSDSEVKSFSKTLVNMFGFDCKVCTSNLDP